MKNNTIIKIALSAAISLLALTSCNNWLDELPDKRAELDTPDKISQLLVSAYPSEMPTLMFEMMSDNYTDNGTLYQVPFLPNLIEKSYRFEDTNEMSWDCPHSVWQNVYGIISTTNEALKAIENLNMPDQTSAQEGEALICRAYAYYVLVTTFCRAYNPDTSDKDPGVPYITEPQTIVDAKHERGTVAEVYANIAKDIAKGLPLIEDNYTAPKFHFNRKAANAFAARFYLFYGKYEEAIECATAAIGENPSNDMRDLSEYNKLPQPQDQAYKYHNPTERNNLMIQPIRSLWGRIYKLPGNYMRYGHPTPMVNMTYRQIFPWDNYSNYGSENFGMIWQDGSSGLNVWGARCDEIFEYTNPVTGIGQPHVVLAPFTVEETLMVRAEAHALFGNDAECANDLSIWYNKNGGQDYSAAQIAAHYETAYPRYNMKSKFIENDTQENLVRAVLAVRRIEGMSLGMRWLDIKRHGIEVTHVDKSAQDEDSSVITLEPYDLRTAIQIPADVIYAGLEANPR